MNIVGKIDRKIGCRRSPLRGFIKDLAGIRERVAGTVTRPGIRVTDRANSRRRPSEKLLTVTVDAGGVLRIVRHIRKRIVAFSNLLPIRCRKRVALAAVEPLMCGDIV